jgi:hypothetical protein
VPFPCLDRPVQGGFGDFERPADLRNGVPFLIEILGNTKLSCGEDFWSAAYPSSGSGCNKSCLCPLPDQVSLKLSKRTKDMENQLPPAGGGINVFCQASVIVAIRWGRDRPKRSKRQTTRVSPFLT